MKFTLEIETGNDAMQTAGDLSRALERLALNLGAFEYTEISSLPSRGTIHDVNGNHVGDWSISA